MVKRSVKRNGKLYYRLTGARRPEALWVYYFTKRLSEEYGYDYSDMNGGGEAPEILSLMHMHGTKIFV